MSNDDMEPRDIIAEITQALNKITSVNAERDKIHEEVRAAERHLMDLYFELAPDCDKRSGDNCSRKRTDHLKDRRCEGNACPRIRDISIKLRKRG